MCVLYHYPERADPCDLFAVSVGHKQSVHVHLLIANEVEGKAVFALHGVAEQFPTWHVDRKVRVVAYTWTHWYWRFCGYKCQEQKKRIMLLLL